MPHAALGFVFVLFIVVAILLIVVIRSTTKKREPWILPEKGDEVIINRLCHGQRGHVLGVLGDTHVVIQLCDGSKQSHPISEVEVIG